MSKKRVALLIFGLFAALVVGGLTTSSVPLLGGACTNQFVRSIAAATGVPTCATVAIGSDVSGLGTGVATWLATPSSANLAAALTDETGTGPAVFQSNATIITPTIAQINNASALIVSNPNGLIQIVNSTGGATNPNRYIGLDSSGLLYINNNAFNTTLLSLTNAGVLSLPGLSSSSAAQTGTLCWTTGTGVITVDTTTTCLLSSAKFKHDIRPLNGSLATVLALKPVSYEYNEMIPGEQVGLVAEDVAAVDDRLVSHEPDGSPRAVRYQQLTAHLIGAIQQQQKQIEELKAQLVYDKKVR